MGLFDELYREIVHHNLSHCATSVKNEVALLLMELCDRETKITGQA